MNPAVDGAVFDFSALNNPLTQPVSLAEGKSASINGLKSNFPNANEAAISVGKNAQLRLMDSEITSTAGGSRGLNISAGAEVEISKSTVSGKQRGLNIMGDGVKINAENSTIISEDYYAINLPSSGTNAQVSMTNSTISGWCILNSWTTGNTFDFTDCTLNATNKYSSTSNAFGAFVFYSDGVNTVNVVDCQVSIKATGDQPQYLILSNDTTKNESCPVCNFKGTTKINATTTNTFLANGGTDDQGNPVDLYIINYWPGTTEYTVNYDDTVEFQGEWDSPNLYAD